MDRYVLPLLLFLGTLVLGFLYIQEPKKNPVDDFQTRKKGSMPYTQVEQYKQEAAMKMGIDRQRAEMDKTLGGPELEPGRAHKDDYHKTELGDSTVTRAHDFRDEGSSRPVTLDQKMDQFLAKKHEYELLEDQQKRAYAREFVKEARRMGFSVIVNDDMEIESVEKIGGSRDVGSGSD